MKRASLLLLLILSVLLPPRTARPCSPGCSEHEIAPPEASVVPANLPAVVIALKNGLGEVPTVITWTDDADVPVSFTKQDDGRWLLLKPDNLLTPGARYSVEVTYPHDCKPGVQARTFLAGPSEPLPFPTPTFLLKPTLVPDFMTARSGSCNARVQAATVRLELGPLDLGGFASIAALESLVDKARWALSLPGQASAPHGLFPAPFNAWKSPIELFSVCNADDSWLDFGLPEGAHEIALRVVIPGIEPGPLSPAADFTLECPEVQEDDPDAPDEVHLDDGSAEFASPDDQPDQQPPTDRPSEETASEDFNAQDTYDSAVATDQAPQAADLAPAAGSGGCAAHLALPGSFPYFSTLLLMTLGLVRRTRRTKRAVEQAHADG